MNIVIVGGHGKIAMRLTRLLIARGNAKIVSVFRNGWQAQEVAATGAMPVVLSLEDDPTEKFAATFEGQNIVYFCAGAEGKGGPQRYRRVDYEGALKVFDAIELVRGTKPRLIMLSAIDVRDRSNIPVHYTEKDIQRSQQFCTSIGPYLQAKFDADKNLSQRTAFKWMMLRPGWLTSSRGTGRASIGKAPLGATISRDDVAYALALLASRPDADGLGIDMNGGDEKIDEALDVFIKKGESDFHV